MNMIRSKKLLVLVAAASLCALCVSAILADPMPEWEWDGDEPIKIAQAAPAPVDQDTETESEEEKVDGRGKPVDEVLEPLEDWINIPVNGPRTLDLIDVEKLVQSLDADRKLLVEIRKDLPQDREEAEIYLKRLKSLTALSDPVRLVPLMNRVLQYSPLYLDWLATEFETQEDQIIEYYIGGARSFNFALEKYRSMALFIIINRLDIAARAIRELDTIYRREDDE